jgi:cell wall-associated NlpC family hydrolase
MGQAACSLLEPPPPRTNLRDVIVDEAVALQGRPYRYHGNDATGFDASGLIQYVYQRSGLHLPMGATAQRAQGQSIDHTQARNGDLLFYSLEETPYQELHVGIYIGRSRMVHIPRNGRVRIEPIDTPFWLRRLQDTVSYVP